MKYLPAKIHLRFFKSSVNSNSLWSQYMVSLEALSLNQS
jgi:hypothetical protein